MQPIEVTEDQYVFIQQLRDAIAEHVVGKYGYVRERDAVQFLIDNLDEDFDLPDSFEVDESIAVSIPAVDETADATVAVSFDESATDSDADEGAGDEETADEETGDEETAEANENADADESDEADAEDGSDDGSADDDDMLNEMMSLLDTHDDKWDEADVADYRYSVDLPDGTVENVQTKDDVRALLFKHYR